MEFKDRQRRRMTGALFVGNAIASTAFLAVVTIASLTAQELTGSTQLAGLPSALSTVGAALGASILTALSRRSGRRSAFCFGFSVAALGGLIAMSSLWLANLGVFLAAMFAIGFGRSVSLLSRFAAGDLWPDDRRASAIGLVVWAATIGSVVGPLMILPASRVGTTYLDAELAGPFAFAGAGFALAALWYFATLRPDPLTLADTPDETVELEPETLEKASDTAAGVEIPSVEVAGAEDLVIVTAPIKTLGETQRSLAELLLHPAVQLALVVLMVSQFVMILVMTMTPLHIRGHHHGLSLVSGVMMAHALGMFAIAPLTGRLVDRLGSRPVIAAGCLLLAISALLSAKAGDAQAGLLTVSLFLLGVGWNFGFVAGSTALQESLALRDRLRLQGLADSVTWISGGIAALASGFILSAWSFPGLALLGAGIALVPLAALAREARLRSL